MMLPQLKFYICTILHTIRITLLTLPFVQSEVQSGFLSMHARLSVREYNYVLEQRWTGNVTLVCRLVALVVMHC